MESKINRRTFIGKVVSDKNDKTITVLVTTYKTHPLYNKRVISSKKFHAHDEKNEAKIGDTVKIVECRPLSHLKRFRLLEIIEHSVVL
ncbi:MAG: 30S ribosomal protein S17 [Candidatus Izemoplasmatales bacterium]|jgi:small subunit ribosomal protein S17|nr:30S ribosomal protein S17 [Candidatus Izemoplasmatales bacterium]MDD4354571.1 30S ribosomal protein S17 [Candidatus Izemoplasmatales bacterium]MDD4988037.1 30S ribosomal protein S17 [Candidatus Izemoplasmatales bacterium]MDY0372794.1 30S ribosomal protein S17 [Candidatus Izemoplasmatales bacterium]NLF48433.1 30S ribosomal protein S17 [Acholeplasmataceae bacterium]